MTEKPDVIKRLLEPLLEMKQNPLYPFPSIIRLTILQGSDVERLAAVVSRADTCVSLHRDAVVRVLPQMCDVDVVCLRCEIQVVAGIPKLQAVLRDDPVRKQRRLPGHVHLAGTEGLKTQAIRRTARNCIEDIRCSLWYLSFNICGYKHLCVHERTILARKQV